MILLASSSPRRREILEMLGLNFKVIPSSADETVPKGLSPAQTVEYLARIKAQAVRNSASQEDIIVSADTIVVIDGQIFGKPADRNEAIEMLSRLSGRTHEVYTGICVNDQVSHECSKVTFRTLSMDEIEAYIDTGEPMDKAGAYGIQGKGSLLVSRIEGDYFNIMGLPVCRLGQMLKNYGVKVI